MMKTFCALIVAFACISASAGDGLRCTLKPADIPKAWLDMVDPCIKAMEDQVQTEMRAAMTYLAMGAHFARDSVNRPGFSKFFLESASEEREHAIKFIEYLLMRGQLTNHVSRLLQYPVKLVREEWASGVDALKDALNLETAVTRSIREIIANCEAPPQFSFNDYHLVDYLTGEFLEEQYKGQRELAGKISTLGKMMATHGPLGEFLFDKTLLKNEL
jgi:ferritin heavy chain